MRVDIYNEDCLSGLGRIPDGSVRLGIFDPPFGIKESGFGKHYKRDGSQVIPGYREAPEQYELFTHRWLAEAKRVLHEDGSMYVFMGHSNLRYLLNMAHVHEFHEINHLIWKFNFGVFTRRKYVTSHFHVLYYGRSKKSKPVFNTFCRFGPQEKTPEGGSLLYRDLEDVFVVNKEYRPGQKKNVNKLPEELIRKLILYSSSPGDTVCDFFMGNFTTAYAALALGRHVCGFELNPNSYKMHMDRVRAVDFGCDLAKLRTVVVEAPPNQGKKVTVEEASAICKDFLKLSKEGKKKAAMQVIQDKYGRGRFSIKNILDKHLQAV